MIRNLRFWKSREQLRVATVPWIERTYHRRRRQRRRHEFRAADPKGAQVTPGRYKCPSKYTTRDCSSSKLPLGNTPPLQPQPVRDTPTALSSNAARLAELACFLLLASDISQLRTQYRSLVSTRDDVFAIRLNRDSEATSRNIATRSTSCGARPSTSRVTAQPRAE